MDSKFEARPLRHQSFILSLWQETGPSHQSPPVWRFSLEDPHTAERRGFREIDDLLKYLDQTISK
jgi:hypothetical protein